MLLVLSITFSILVITVSYLRRISRRKPSPSHSNCELLKFYDLPVSSSPQVLYKQLVCAASEFLTVSESLEQQIDFVEPLYRDRLVSDEYFEGLCEEKKELELEKMVLESESENIRKGSKKDIFVEASKGKSKKKGLRIVEDSLFSHKRGVLENELKNKLV